MAQDVPQDHSELVDLVHQVGSEGKATFVFADTHHPSSEIRKAVGDPKVLQALREEGFDTLAIEGNPAKVPEARAYANADQAGKDAIVQSPSEDFPYYPHDPEKRAEWTKAHLDIQAHAQEAGLSVAAPDPRYAWLDEHSKNMSPEQRDRQALLKDYQGVFTDAQCADIQSEAYLKSLPPEKLDALMHTGAGERLTHDPSANAIIVENTQSASANLNNGVPGKTAYMYGADHVTGTNDLNELAPNAVTVAIAEKPGNPQLADQYKRGELDMPEYAYYTNSNRAVALDNTRSQEEFLYGAPGKKEFSLSPEQLAECRASVAHLKPYQSGEYHGETVRPSAPQTNAPAQEHQR